MIKNPPRFFFAQPPSRTRRSQLSRAHTHFHTPQTFENTNQFPVWPTVSPYLSQYPPDSRQQLSSVLSHLTLFSFSAYAPHVFSTRLLIQSPSLSPSPFQRNEPPSSLGLRPSQVSQSLRSHDCSLQFRNCHTATHSRHQPGCVFWGSMFHSSSHKFQNLHRDSTPCGYSLASPLDAPLPGAITGLSYPPICPFKQYRQVQISPPWPTVSQRCRHPPASPRPAVSQLAVGRIHLAATDRKN